ncbi:MAG: DUF523 domain-containing protein [Candidatus Neomarinimicrobiota bacterium]
MKHYLIISSCLLGANCRYDGGTNALAEEILAQLDKAFVLIPICPEQMGGLSTPRLPAEIRGEKVIRKDEVDVTKEFQLGSREALNFAKRYKAKYALLKANSPSCGNDKIYDGTFSDKLVKGKGTTAKEFFKVGIKVYNEKQINNLLNTEV